MDSDGSLTRGMGFAERPKSCAFRAPELADAEPIAGNPFRGSETGRRKEEVS